MNTNNMSQQINATQMINLNTAKNAVILTSMYEVAFNREPDAEGFQYWMNEMANGKTTHDIAVIWQNYIPKFTYDTVDNVIDTFVMNGFEHHASTATINYWGLLYANAVPSYELMYDAAVQLVGMQNEFHSFNAVY